MKGTALDGGSEDETVVAVENGVVINASGYKDQLKRQYGLVGLAGIAVTVDNAWVALGSSISVSIRMICPLFALCGGCKVGRSRRRLLTLLPLPPQQSTVARRALSLV